jgi:hypothetical protein
MCGCFKDSVVAFVWGFFLLFVCVCVAMRVLKGSSIVRCLGNSLIQIERGMAGGGRRGFISKDFIFLCVC